MINKKKLNKKNTNNKINTSKKSEKKVSINHKEFISIYLKGIFMGLADTIPGISGGTIAFITGIYERLINSISEVKISSLKYIFKPKKFYCEVKKLDLKLFIPLIFGLITAILVGINLINFILEKNKDFLYSFFIGLIISSFVVLIANIKSNIKNFCLIILGLTIGWIISGNFLMQITPNLITTFFAGFIAISAMILPGISGAYILLILNHYGYIINSLKNLDLLVITIFGAGVIIGLLSFTKLLNKLLKSYKNEIFSVLIGLMIGTLRTIFNKVNFQSNLKLNLIGIILGFILVFLINFKKFKCTKI